MNIKGKKRKLKKKRKEGKGEENFLLLFSFSFFPFLLNFFLLSLSLFKLAGRIEFRGFDFSNSRVELQGFRAPLEREVWIMLLSTRRRNRRLEKGRGEGEREGTIFLSLFAFDHWGGKNALFCFSLTLSFHGNDSSPKMKPFKS